MKKIILVLLSLFIAGFSFSQINNLGGGSGTSTFTDLTVNGTFYYSPPHAHVSFSDSAYTPAMTQNNWVSVTNAANNLFTQTDFSGITFAGDSLTIAAGNAGDYIFVISLSFTGNNTDVYEIALFRNAVLESVKIERSTTNNATGNISLPWYAESAAVGDDFTLKIRNTNNNNDASFVACSWVSWMLHPE